MTAVPNWDIVGRLVATLSWPEPPRPATEWRSRGSTIAMHDRLHDFCAGMLGDRDSAADCVQDTFCIAATRLPQLRDPDKLRPWLYSIARNEALRRIRERRRETPSEDLLDTASGEAGPDTLAARTELADLIADTAGGLSDRDRSVLELAFRHGLNGPDLAEALGVSPSNANTIVHRLRDTIERSLGALLVSRRVRSSGGCQELAAILDGWDGHFNVLMRKRISRHIESCDVCDEERRRLVSPAALLGAAVFIPAPEWLRERTLSEIQLTSATSHMGDDRRDGARDSRSFLLPVALFVSALIAAGTVTFIWLNQKDTVITPTEVHVTESATSAPPPPPPTVAPPPPPPTGAPPAPAPTVEKTIAPPPTRRTPVIEPPPPASPPVSEPPPPEVTTEESPLPPPPPPPPPWPNWLPPLPPWPPQPPPGGDSTPRLVIDPPPPSPPPGSSVRP